MSSSTTEKALQVLRHLPRVKISNLRDTPGSNYVTKDMMTRGPRQRVLWKRDGRKQHMGWPRLGYEGGQTPFYLKIPMENYNERHFARRQYPPLSLRQLQLMIDTGRLDPTRPIDLAALCNTRLYFVDPMERHFGVHLTADGVDCFRAKLLKKGPGRANTATAYPNWEERASSFVYCGLMRHVRFVYLYFHNVLPGSLDDLLRIQLLDWTGEKLSIRDSDLAGANNTVMVGVRFRYDSSHPNPMWTFSFDEHEVSNFNRYSLL